MEASLNRVDADEIPLPSDLDEEEESPYLRRQKAVAVRRSRFSRRARGLLHVALFVFAGVVPLGYGTYKLAGFALRSPRFSVTSGEDVVLRGNEYVTREEVLSALGISTLGLSENGPNIFRLSLENRRRQIESIPWVRSATVSRAYPHRLLLEIVERTPVAFVNVSGRVKLVDEDGVLLETPEKGIFDFPVLRGLEVRGGVVGPRPRLAMYLGFNQQLSSELASAGWLLSEADLSDPEDLKALMVQERDTIQVHFGNKDFIQRFHNLLASLPEARKAHPKIDSVDLRYKDQVVVSPAEAAATTPPEHVTSEP